jgi:hypothetical protein
MQCLEMPARTFFSVLREGRKLEDKKRFFFLHELVDVAVCGNVQDYKYIKELKDYYAARVYGIKQKANPREFDADDAEQRQNAANVLFDAFRQKKRIEGLSGGR